VQMVEEMVLPSFDALEVDERSWVASTLWPARLFFVRLPLMGAGEVLLADARQASKIHL